AWAQDRDALLQDAERLLAGVQRMESHPLRGEKQADDALLQRVHDALSAEFDSVHGGFGGRPKFPNPSYLEALLVHHDLTGDARSLDIVARSLQGMANGGIYDHLGGGFHRYSVDEKWRVPHFEKMLYDNAQLIPL